MVPFYNKLLFLTPLFTRADYFLVVPEVVVTADRYRVNAGDSVTLFCNVIRSNPMGYTYSWNLNGNTLGQTSNSLNLSSFGVADVGIYNCLVTNEFGTGRNGSRIDLGGEKLCLV